MAIVFESLSSTVLKLGGRVSLPVHRVSVFLLPGGGHHGPGNAVAWQLLLERLPLTAGSLSAEKGLTYVLIFVWAAVMAMSRFSQKQIIGMAVIIVGMVVKYVR